MIIHGYSSNLYVWQERYKMDGLDDSMEAILRGCAEAGLDAVEPPPKPEVYALVAANGLRASGSYLGLALHEPYEALAVDAVVRPAAELLAQAGGTDFILNPNAKRVGAEPVQLKSEHELKRQGDNMTRIARLVEPLGLKVSMHNHAAAYELADGDLRSVTAYAGPEVGLCVDTGWAHTAGHDPLEWVRRYPARVFGFHFRNQFGAVPTEHLLEGEIDIAGLIGLLRDIGYAGWLSLELWQPKQTEPKLPMAEDVRRSIAYLRELVAGCGGDGGGGGGLAR
ncbi:sugar phosphate isomerase/epimerase family protein [Paenibacillus koleovorans]|uniref:sugar phosphate isomerase/epimerase family protein n=1 Tax=Paenibacillus koleovorans TaxID=121608 RepID=UPI000FDC914E|nr:sugar phosphate isomerase/epimerase [Paenibacillus koleovorans]